MVSPWRRVPVAWALWRTALLALVLCVGTHRLAWGESKSNSCFPIPVDGKGTVELTQSGRYCMNADLPWEKAGTAIHISGANISLNLKGNSLRGNKERPDQIGILVDNESKNISIENGSIEWVQVGIRAQDVRQLHVEELNLSNISWFGIHVSGGNNVIINSRFLDIGNLDDGGAGDAYAIGILAGGQSMVIQGNKFHNVLRQPVVAPEIGEGVSILLSEESNNISIVGNSISNDFDKIKDTIGLWARAENVTIDENQFNNIERPIEGAYGGMMALTRNVFKYAAKINKTNSQKKYRAVAMKFNDSSSGLIYKNDFSGYSCPIQISGEVMRLVVKSESNNVVLPGGRRLCEGKGVWHADGIHWLSSPRKSGGQP